MGVFRFVLAALPAGQCYRSIRYFPLVGPGEPIGRRQGDADSFGSVLHRVAPVQNFCEALAFGFVDSSAGTGGHGVSDSSVKWGTDVATPV